MHGCCSLGRLDLICAWLVVASEVDLAAKVPQSCLLILWPEARGTSGGCDCSVSLHCTLLHYCLEICVFKHSRSKPHQRRDTISFSGLLCVGPPRATCAPDFTLFGQSSAIVLSLVRSAESEP